MRNKKLITLLVLLLALILFVGACGGKDKKDDSDPGTNNSGDNNGGNSGNTSGDNNGGNNGNTSGDNNGGNSGNTSGDNNGNTSGGNNGGNNGSSTLSIDEMVTSDRQMMENKGYATTFVENTMVLRATESALKAESESLSAVLNCDKGRDAVYIYYFKTSSDAKACYDANWASDDKYSLKDNRIIYDSTAGNVFEDSGSGSETGNENGGSSGSNTSGDLTTDDLDAILSADYHLLYDLHEYYLNYEKGENNTYLNSYAPGAGFVREEIYGILTANSTTNASSITVYYFWSEALAQKYYNQKWSNNEYYTLSGVRVICDTDGAGYIK